MKQPLNDRIAEQAIQWVVLLRSGMASEADRQRFAAWREASPAHADAVRRLEGGLGSVTLPSVPMPHRQAVRRLLDAVPSPLRHARRALLVGGMGVGVAALVDLQMPLSDLTADMRTATSERRDFKLAGGHQLRLNARSAVDVVPVVHGYNVRLRRGSVLAVAGAWERLRVSSPAGEVECARGIVCTSLDAEGGMTVAVLDGSVALSTPAGTSTVAHSGRVHRLGRAGIELLRLSARSVAAWTQGMVEVEHQPLADVIAALRPYHAGMIELHPDAAGLHVTGRFPLDPRRALQMLVDTLPIDVRYIAGLWVRISRR
ncbi:FecR family protein [Ralstonia solanacearum]|uniref:FecR family protein n=1 Tax=Ralstonia solanacearum TaxID=305 RepID=A0AAW5ZTB0_RALSL|nr:FecR family protein [Ralstonia solanacearum]MDB0572747.1 FecR family protein [Ralstonia solanacearum]